jgi:hypothetical protein
MLSTTRDASQVEALCFDLLLDPRHIEELERSVRTSSPD